MSQIPYWMHGTHIGGVEIIGVTRSSERAPERVYQVRHDCCGRIEDLGHEVIRRRIREHASHCQRCGYRQGGKTGGQRSKRVTLTTKTSSFRLIADMPADERPKVPSAESILTLWDRANARVGMRQGVRG